MHKKILFRIIPLLCIVSMLFPVQDGQAAFSIVGAWSGTIKAGKISAPASASFTESGSYYISAYGLSSSGSYSCSSGKITLKPSSPSGFPTTTMSLSLNGNHCSISGTVKGIRGSLSLTRKTFKLSKSAVTVDEGKSLTLTAKPPSRAAAYKTLVWKSSDPSIASVTNKGKVVAYKAGIVVITATASNGDSAFCVITVRSLAVVSVVISKTSVKLAPGKSVRLSAQVLPKYAKVKTITWSSSNPGVATVSSKGSVKAIKTGIATITAMASNGVKATCNVYIGDVLVTKVSLSKSRATMSAGSTLQLSAAITPSSAVNKTLTWKSSNSSVAAVNFFGQVRALRPGTAVITVKAHNGISASCTIKVVGALVLREFDGNSKAAISFRSAWPAIGAVMPRNCIQ